ncbi:MAG: ATPase AAA [Sulfuricurvum sp. PC08-66]|nr:MAG: ATPase AAA [Sulfuricurvum sp. PC08-66]
MKYLIDFLQVKDIQKSGVYEHLNTSKEEAEILKSMAKHYIAGREEVIVADILIEIYGDADFGYLEHLVLIKQLLELGWLNHQPLHSAKVADMSLMGLLNSVISLTPSFLQLLEQGNLDMNLPEVKPYADHLEYLQDQFFRIELYQKISSVRYNYNENALNINRLKKKLDLLEKRIDERIKESSEPIVVESFFVEQKLSAKEQILFLALLKEEYSANESSLREMNSLIDIISVDEYDRIKNRALLEEGSKLMAQGIIDYDEILNPFGGISRAFFIVDEVLQGIIHPQKKKRVQRLKLDSVIKEQEIFELVDPKTTMEDVVLNPKTMETLESILKQLDKRVYSRLQEWGIKERKKGIDARMIFYGPPGTGKTLTAYSLSKSLKKQVLSFDCSKILSMYVGESEKNVRKIFDTYRELTAKTKTEPVLLLNEADQFLSARTSGGGASADQMHNQMQNIFLEQIEKFEGVLIATTNLLENIDTAFSRRFNYKLEFKRPTKEQRKMLWKLLLPKNAPYEKGFDIDKLTPYDLSGGQINLIIKNTAYQVATQEQALFKISDFVTEIDKEKSGNFDKEKLMGFINS